MDHEILFVWNGWGILFTSCIAMWQFLHILVTLKLGSGTPLRNALTLIVIISVPLVFLLSGWVAGLLALPIGTFSGGLVARIALRHHT